MRTCMGRTVRAAGIRAIGPEYARVAGFPHSRTGVAPEGIADAHPETGSMPTNVLIIGGGPAALEAALALNRLAGERVSATLLAPETNLTYRPLSVLAPFAA